MTGLYRTIRADAKGWNSRIVTMWLELVSTYNVKPILSQDYTMRLAKDFRIEQVLVLSDRNVSSTSVQSTKTPVSNG